MDLGLSGRTAVVTGGSMGIGRAIAEALAAEGVNQVLLARGEEALTKTAEAIERAHPVEVLAIPTDLTVRADVDAAAAAAADRFGSIEILVNNAGGRMRKLDRQILWEDEDWLGDVDAKTLAMLRAVRAFHPYLDKTGRGRILNIAGVAGVMVWETAMTHGLNNAAMIHLTRYLARDLARENITVNAVVPGLIASEWRASMWAPAMAEKRGQSVEEFLLAYTRSMGIAAERWGETSEVADLVVFLASDRARYISGARLDIDGGMGVNARP
jgi:3-oxoacyl-[acyl-carrier protein] reductase